MNLTSRAMWNRIDELYPEVDKHGSFTIISEDDALVIFELIEAEDY